MVQDWTHKEFAEKSAKRAKRDQALSYIKAYKIEVSDETNILDPSYMHVYIQIWNYDAGQNLIIRKHFAQMNVLMSPPIALGLIAGQFEIMRGDFVQVLHNGRLH